MRSVAILLLATTSAAAAFNVAGLRHATTTHRCAPIALRERCKPPPPGAPSAFATFKRWTGVQLTADATSITALCILTGKTPLDLYNEQSVLLWVLLGPALITFGGVWARITQTNADERYSEDDFFMQKLGGKAGVASLRYAISEALRF